MGDEQQNRPTAETAREYAGRTNLRLSPQARDALEEIMRLGGFATLAEAARRAIGDELFLLQERNNGWSVILRKGDRYREIAWPS